MPSILAMHFRRVTQCHECITAIEVHHGECIPLISDWLSNAHMQALLTSDTLQDASQRARGKDSLNLRMEVKERIGLLPCRVGRCCSSHPVATAEENA